MPVLFASKVNIISNIYQVYEEPELLHEIYANLKERIKDDIGYYKEITYYKDDEERVKDSYFKFANVNYLDSTYDYSIWGFVLKQHKIFANSVNPKTGETSISPIDNDEKIMFYFDFSKEVVIFYQSNRFGYKEFNEAFANILNNIMSDLNFQFELSLINDGLSLEELRTSLQEFGTIKELTIRIIPPNPSNELLNRIKENGIERLNEYKDANISEKEVKFKSKQENGINLQSELINSSIDEIESVNSQLTSDEALKNGYLKIEAVNKNGKRLSSEESKPIKKNIKEEDKQPNQFIIVCKEFITNIFG